MAAALHSPLHLTSASLESREVLGLLVGAMALDAVLQLQLVTYC